MPCVAPANKPCQIFSATAVPPSSLRLQPVGGSTQILPVGQTFQPLTVRVTDSATPAHPVLAANVTFQVVVFRPTPVTPPVSVGGIIITRNPAPIIVSSSQMSVLSDEAGQAVLQPPGSAQGAIVIQGTAAVGPSVLPFSLQSLSAGAQSRPAIRNKRKAMSRVPRGRIHLLGEFRARGKFGPLWSFLGNSRLFQASNKVKKTAALLCSIL